MHSIVASLKRIARMIVALNDVEFNRFNSIFNENLHAMSVDVRAVQQASLREILKSVEDTKIYNYVPSNTRDKFAEYVKGVLFKARRMIDDFIGTGIWNLGNAVSIYNLCAGIKDGLSEMFDGSFIWEYCTILGEFVDYFEAFNKSAQQYMDSSMETATNSAFNYEVENLMKMIDVGFGRELRYGINNFKTDMKRVLEKFKEAGVSEIRGGKEKNEIEGICAHGNTSSFTNPASVFYNVLVPENPPMDKESWERISESFERRYRGPILQLLGRMVNAIERFLQRHDKNYSAIGGNASTGYYDDAHKLYSNLVNWYAQLLRVTSNIIDLKFLDETFSTMKAELDKI